MRWRKSKWLNFQRRRKRTPSTKLESLHLSNIAASAHIMRLSSMRHLHHSGKFKYHNIFLMTDCNACLASWWSTQTTEISSRKSQNIRRNRLTSKKMISGASSSRSLKDWKPCMKLIFSTVIWKAQTCSWIKMALRSWVTWMFPKLPRKVFSILKQEHHTTQAQKCGVISLMMWRVTYGPWAVFCTNRSRCDRHSGQMTWLDYIRKFFVECTQKFPITFQKILLKL